ncbi:MAG: hypothetical protein JST67_04470 [Bacteroidetes bacterium]|nr:hypothetical protein [Bacteroidota bacterium]
MISDIHTLRKIKHFIVCIALAHFVTAQSPCDCNTKELIFSEKYVRSQPLIFRGKTLAVHAGTDYDKTVFLITQLFKGSSSQQCEIYFEKNSECPMLFSTGEDWLIYAQYEKGKALVRYCSRCRKNLINLNSNTNLSYIKTDISFDEEIERLQEMLGNQKVLQNAASTPQNHSNIIPNGQQRVWLILFSALGLIAAYFLINKILKK